MLFSRAAAVVFCVLAGGGWLGCVSEPKAGRAAAPSISNRGGIQEINLLAIPVALNLDDKPGLDGFVIKIYPGNRSQPKPLLIEEGAIEVFMFDGIPGVTTEASSEPRRVWNYTAQELRQYEIGSSIGPCYQLAPLWGDAKPTGSRISVIARYTAPDGRSVTSAPSIISIALK